MVLFRALGWLLLGVSVAVAVRDALSWWSEGAFHPLALDDLWLQLDYNSLHSLETGASRSFWAVTWSRLAAPVLRVPALPVFVIAGLLVLWLGARRGERAEAGVMVGARPPRRRRSRGGLS